MTDLTSQAALDLEALRRKYDAEREKRLRKDGAKQWSHVDDRPELLDFASDRNVVELARDPIGQTVEVLIVGAGLAGLMTAVSLRQRGIDDIRIIERGGDFGGVWYWNRYPGAACDVESYVYMPMLEELGYMPSQKYAPATEIFEHCQRIASKFDLYPNACFQTAVTDIGWDEQACRWSVKTNRGDHFMARYICLAPGAFTMPKLPGIPGITSFKGHMWHTSRWDYEVTKGDQYGNLTGLSDKRVAVIGTGATSLQCVPHLGEWSKELFVFQRTPVSVDIRGNRPTDPEWAKSLEPGWQRKRMRHFDAFAAGIPQAEDLIDDGWTRSARAVFMLPETDPPLTDPVEIAKALQVADFMKMESLRQRIDEEVEDPATAEALKPYFNLMCKRPGFHDSYLPTFNRPNVHLVDTKGRGVDSITEHGIVVDGTEYPVDCIVFATGFETGGAAYNHGRFEVRGIGGRSLEDKWGSGITTLHGVMTHGFPNMFVLTSFAGHFTGFNVVSVIMDQSEHIANMVAYFEQQNVVRAQPTAAAEEAWVQEVQAVARAKSSVAPPCTPGYYNAEGELGSGTTSDGLYAGGPDRFREITDHWLETGIAQDIELVRAPQA